MNSIVWWEIETADPEGSMRFYGDMFGWTFTPEFEGYLDRPYWLVKHLERGIGGLQQAAPGAPPAQTGVRLYVEVDDLEATVETAVENGATVERTRTYLGGDDFWFATVRDPQGISLGLWTSRAIRS